MPPLDSGMMFGRWTTTGQVSDKDPSKELVRCQCGTEKFVARKSLCNGTSQSCGCLRNERRRAVARLNGASTRDNLYRVWNNMMTRCYNLKSPNYKWYGARGVSVFESWHDFLQFAEAVRDSIGDRPSSKHSLDRVDVSKNYEPGNIRWATQYQQSRNTSRNRLLTFGGKTLSLTDWAHAIGMTPNGLKGRLSAGWSLERALKEGSGKTA